MNGHALSAEARAHRRRSFKERERRAAAKREQFEKQPVRLPCGQGPANAVIIEALTNLRRKSVYDARPRTDKPAKFRPGQSVFDSEKRDIRGKRDEERP